MAAQALRVEHVLCPTDFSAFSVQVRGHAAAIARALGSDLSFVHVHPREPLIGGEFSYLAPTALDPVARGKLLDKLEAFSRAAEPVGVPVESLLLEGDPSLEVLRVAEQLPADLLVLGLHPDERLKHFLLGSMSEELLRRAPCPVMTVRQGVGPTAATGTPFHRILCATDLHAEASDVVSYAVSLAQALQAELTLLHVLERVPQFEPGSAVQFSVAEVHAFRQGLAEEARERLRAAVSDEDRERLAVRDLVKAGSAHEQILRVALEEGSQLVVLGARGHGLLERMLFGSTARRVVRQAPCPVLIARTTSAASAPLRKRFASRELVSA
jgi:nucleotide-binding universal stress UspA family protein